MKPSLYEIASKYTSLKSRGNGSYYGLCPLHNEDTPSFHINDNLGVFYCFGCKQGGNTYQFISLVEGVPLSEVGKVLRNKFGIDIDKDFSSRKDFLNPIKQLIGIIESANLNDSEFVNNYLLNRLGSKLNVAVKFFFVPEEKEAALINLVKKDVSLYEKLKSLAVFHEIKDGRVSFAFSNRIFTQITDESGNPVGIIGRHISDKLPKYYMSRFPKREYLVFLNEALKVSRGEKRVFVLEGIFDALQLLNHNVPAVAILGSTVSIEQIDKLNSNFSSVYFVFDGDMAGIKGIEDTAKTIIETNRPSFSSFFLFLSEKDVDELVREEGLEAFYSLKTKSVYDAYIDVILRKMINSGLKKKDILREELFIKLLGIFKNYKENSHAYNLLLRFSERTKIPLETLIFRVDLEKKKDLSKLYHDNSSKSLFLSIQDRKFVRSLVYCIKNPESFAKYKNRLANYKTDSEAVQALMRFYLKEESEVLLPEAYSLLIDVLPPSSEEYVKNFLDYYEKVKKIDNLRKMLFKNKHQSGASNVSR